MNQEQQGQGQGQGQRIVEQKYINIPVEYETWLKLRRMAEQMTVSIRSMGQNAVELYIDRFEANYGTIIIDSIENSEA